MDHSHPIKCLADAQAYLRSAIEAQTVWHLEDDPSGIIQRDGTPLFTEEEIPLVRRRCNELYAIKDWGRYDCPIGYLLDYEEVWSFIQTP